MTKGIVFLIIGALVVLIEVALLREFWCWYWKIKILLAPGRTTPDIRYWEVPG